MKSTRRFISFVMAAFAAAFLCTLLISPTSHAAGASWNSSSSISYNSNEYRQANDSINKNLGLADNPQSYTYVEPSKEELASDGLTDENGIREIRVIFFAPGTDVSTATTANYKTYTYVNSSKYTDPSSVVNISIEQQSSSSTTDANGSSCNIDGGMGWIICPISNTLAAGTDWLFKTLTTLLTVKPLLNDHDSALYKAWSFMRDIANVAFVIAFIAIIYSQLTNFGISNYGIKKMLPRLVIAVILVNLSYFICAIAVDASNIMGTSIQDALMGVRNTLNGNSGNGWGINFGDYTAFALSGGTAATIGTVAVIATVSNYTAAGLIYLLAPALVAAFLAVLVALLVMAARQAIIFILVIISPLAFVAFLLPNTEKWYEKWQSTMLSMLMLFPAFAVVFGGSQLAGAAIIQSADSLFIILVGMLIQVIPLLITPLLKNIGGPIIGKLTNAASGYAKGLTNKSREFTKPLAEAERAKQLAKEVKPINAKTKFGRTVRSYTPGRRLGQTLEHNTRKRDYKKTANEGIANARWANSSDFKTIDQDVRYYTDKKAVGESESEIRYNQAKNIRGRREQTLDTRIRLAADQNMEQKEVTDSNYEVFKAEKYQSTDEYKKQSLEMQNMIKQAHITAESISIQSIRKQTAKHVQENELAALLEKDSNQKIRDIAGASIIDPLGAQRARSSAIKTVSRAHADTIENATAVIARGNLNDNTLLELSLGKSVMDSGGRTIEATNDMVEAAISRVSASGNIGNVIRLGENLDLTPGTGKKEDFRNAFTEGLRKNSARPKFFSNTWMGKVDQGIVGDVKTKGVDDVIRTTVKEKKLSALELLSQDKYAIDRVTKAIKRDKNSFDKAGLDELKNQIDTIYATPEYAGRVGEREDYLQALLREL